MQSRAKNRQETGARSAQVENLASAGSPRGPLRPSCIYQGGGRSGPRGLGLTVEQSRPIMCLHSFSGLGPLYQRAHWGDGEGGAKKDLKPRYHRESTFMLLAVTEKMQLCSPDAFFDRVCRESGRKKEQARCGARTRD